MRKACRRRQSCRGVILTILLIIVIVLVLGAILVPCFIGARSQSQWTACMSNMKNIATALEMHAKDNGGHYPRMMEYLVPKYLKAIPACPAAEKETYSITYRTSRKPDAFTFYCFGRNHAKVSGIRENYPQYSSREGLFPK